MRGYFLFISFPIYIQGMEIIIDKIAIWRASWKDGLTCRTIPASTRYKDEQSGILLYSEKPMYRYAKNYKKGKTTFCLFVRTYRDDKNGVEVELDNVAKTITEEYAKKINNLATIENFEYTTEKLKGDK